MLHICGFGAVAHRKGIISQVDVAGSYLQGQSKNVQYLVPVAFQRYLVHSHWKTRWQVFEIDQDFPWISTEEHVRCWLLPLCCYSCCGCLICFGRHVNVCSHLSGSFSSSSNFPVWGKQSARLTSETSGCTNEAPLYSGRKICGWPNLCKSICYPINSTHCRCFHQCKALRAGSLQTNSCLRCHAI